MMSAGALDGLYLTHDVTGVYPLRALHHAFTVPLYHCNTLTVLIPKK